MNSQEPLSSFVQVNKKRVANLELINPWACLNVVLPITGASTEDVLIPPDTGGKLRFISRRCSAIVSTINNTRPASLILIFTDTSGLWILLFALFMLQNVLN